MYGARPLQRTHHVLWKSALQVLRWFLCLPALPVFRRRNLLPKEIVELNVVETLVKHGDIVITVGGGGIPVVKTETGLKGVASVIDKDRSSSKLALDIHADKLVILTAVDRVCINFNKPNQQALASMTVAEAEKYIEEKHFAPGSMLPKVEACLEFVRNSNGEALITSLEKASAALKGETGTIIRK